MNKAQQIRSRFVECVHILIFKRTEPDVKSVATSIGMSDVSLGRIIKHVTDNRDVNEGATAVQIANLCTVYGFSGEYILTGLGQPTIRETLQEELNRYRSTFKKISKLVENTTI